MTAPHLLAQRQRRIWRVTGLPMARRGVRVRLAPHPRLGRAAGFHRLPGRGWWAHAARILPGLCSQVEIRMRRPVGGA